MGGNPEKGPLTPKLRFGFVENHFCKTWGPLYIYNNPPPRGPSGALFHKIAMPQKFFLVGVWKIVIRDGLSVEMGGWNEDIDLYLERAVGVYVWDFFFLL